MKKAIAIATCLMAMGPGLALADHYKHTKVVVKNYHPHSVERRYVEKVVVVKQPKRHKRGRRYDEVVYGRVVDVEPVYRMTTYSAPTQSCVRYIDEPRRYNSHTSTVVGAVIGAAVGHAIGDSHGDPKAAALAGGVIGASFGRDVGNHMYESRHQVVDGPCQPSRQQHTRREVVEYVVSYRYNGEVYRTRMDYDPGEWIALDVNVKPA